MPANAPHDLIIDSSVARASGGEEAAYPTSKNCRDFLKAFMAAHHYIVMSPPITEEWNKHKSIFVRQWLVSMFARKRVKRVEPEALEELRARLALIASSQKDHDAMLKDFHLVEAALVTDRTVIALDEVVGSLFSEACQTLGQLKNIAWVNPDKSEENAIIWLEAGAEPEKHRMLGFREETTLN